MADDEGHAAEIIERVLVEPKERLELLIPHGLLVTMPRAAQGQPEDPGATPLTAVRMERRRSAEEVDLALLAGIAMTHPGNAALAQARNRNHNPRWPWRKSVSQGL